MISLQELRQVTMKKGRKPWLYWLFHRRVALYFAWLFLHTPITANQVTLLSVFAGLVAAALFGSGEYRLAVIAAVMYQLHYILDSVDGQMARYTKSDQNPVGLYYDRLGSYFVESMVYLGIGIGAYQRFDEVMYLFLGFSMSLSWLFYKITIGDKYRIYAEKGIVMQRPAPGAGRAQVETGILVLLKQGFDAVGTLTRNPTVFSIITVAAFFHYTHIALVYGLVFPFVALGSFLYESRIKFKYAQ
ncbi:MAG TPA: CDP-alcohol phosphatidyltransferase family protein [Candidatus Nanoarchaeia archaeon]|nr:CDP-alcohol phosphatidyltransferase family protein [Candidatus Nanoarchaeia archaeon]